MLLGNSVLPLGKQFDSFLQPYAYQVAGPLSWVFTPKETEVVTKTRKQGSWLRYL